MTLRAQTRASSAAPRRPLALLAAALLSLAACGGPDAGPTSAPDLTASSSGAGTSTGGDEAFRAVLDPLVAPHVDPGGAPGKAVGLAVGVVGPGLRLVAGYGLRERGGPPVEADTVFEIGSLTKAVTGVLLARSLARGEAALTDAIDPRFPLGAPHFAGQSITLLDLATHTSGLPPMPDNTHSADPLNPGAGYTTQDLAAFMASYTLTRPPGAALVYSNLGAGVLAHDLVARGGAASYEALVRRDVAEPLDMPDTWITAPTDAASRLARGYRQATDAPANAIGEGLAGAGALRSTGADMLRFAEAALGVGDPDLVAAWALVLEPRRPSPLGQDGWIGLLVSRETVDGRDLHAKDGQTAGFASYLLLAPSIPAAVVLLANSSDLAEGGALKALARDILDALPP